MYKKETKQISFSLFEYYINPKQKNENQKDLKMSIFVPLKVKYFCILVLKFLKHVINKNIIFFSRKHGKQFSLK